jgi:dephospho-CoA kinase
MSLIIGLTGGIASGKSTVSRMLLEYGIPVIDADIEARRVVEKGEKAYLQIVETFGEGILATDGEIDRGKLGSIVFHDEEKRLQLNAIVHPAVRDRMNMEKVRLLDAGQTVVVLDIPLLFESKLTHLVEKVLLVYVEENVQLERLMVRNHLSEADALARIQSQMPLKEKLALADEVINNNGSIEETREQLLRILDKWNANKTA